MPPLTAAGAGRAAGFILSFRLAHSHLTRQNPRARPLFPCPDAPPASSALLAPHAVASCVEAVYHPRPRRTTHGGDGRGPGSPAAPGRSRTGAPRRAGDSAPAERSAIPYDDLPPASPDSLLVAEWDSYRKEVGRLLAEGRQGQFVLIKGERIIGLYPTEREALDLAYRMFPGQAFLVHQLQASEPLLRCVSVRLWPR